MTRAFILLIFFLSLILWLAEPERSDARLYIAVAGLAFLLIYLAMTGVFVVKGYAKALKVRDQVRARIPLPKQ